MHVPKDIRLMVYEQLPVVTWHYRLPAGHESRNKSQWWKSSQSHVVLIMTGICVQVMATCKQIQEESASIIKRKVRTELCRQIPRIILEGDDFHPLLHHPYHRGVLVEIFEWLLHWTGKRECPADWDRKKDFEKWWISRQWFESEQNLRDRADRSEGRLNSVAKFIWQAGVILDQMYQERQLSIPAHNISIPITVPVAILRKPTVWIYGSSNEDIDPSRISSIRREVAANLVYPLQTTFVDRSESPVTPTHHRLPTSFRLSEAGHEHIIYFPLPFASFSGHVVPALSVDAMGGELWRKG